MNPRTRRLRRQRRAEGLLVFHLEKRGFRTVERVEKHGNPIGRTTIYPWTDPKTGQESEEVRLELLRLPPGAHQATWCGPPEMKYVFFGDNARSLALDVLMGRRRLTW